MKSDKTIPDYKYIKKLGIKIRKWGGIPYIRGEEIKKVLTAAQQKKFDNYFGVQTALALDDGTSGLYPYDVEAVLVRIFESGKLTGSQRFFD